MDVRLLWTVILTFFLFVGHFDLKTALAAPLDDDDTVQGDEDGKSKHKPPPVALKHNETYLVAEGETLRMPCNIEHNDDVAIIWYKGNSDTGTMIFVQDALILKNDNYGYEKEKDTLIIHHVNQTAAGLYTCMTSPEVKTTHTVQIKDTSKAEGGRNYASVSVLVTTILTTLLLCR